MITIEQALEHVLKHATPKAATVLPTCECLGLTLAEDVAADVDSPPHDKALVDGYAIRMADLQDQPFELSVIEEVTAGAVPTLTVESGQATRIMTGAPIPDGADGVVMIEDTEADDNGQRVRINTASLPESGNIMSRAASFAIGDVLLKPDTTLRAIELAALAEVGRTEAKVIPRPTLAVMTSGNELVTPDMKPSAGQIRNSNNPMLVAQATQAGATATDLGIARDEEASISQLVTEGLTHDVLVLSGGVSAGVLDLIPQVLAAAGVVEVFHKIQLKPGKPLWFGVYREQGHQCLVFGLPGNPVSSLVCFELFVRPAIGQLSGRAGQGLAKSTAALAKSFLQRGDRPTYFPARLDDAGNNSPKVQPLAWQGSADLATLLQANALAYFPPGQRQFDVGDIVDVLRLP